MEIEQPCFADMANSRFTRENLLCRDCVPWQDTGAAGAQMGEANVKEQFLTGSLADKEVRLDVLWTKGGIGTD